MTFPRPSANNSREFLFTEQDFERIRRLIHQHAGISLDGTKHEMVYSRLAKRLRANRLSTFSSYIALLETRNAAEWEAFVNALTTNLTFFFREEHHFRLLAEHVGKIREKRAVSLWCAACSTGEEAYSMAMTMAEHFDSLAPPVQILATDLDTTVLQKARRGVYPASQLKNVPEALVKKYFTQEGGEYRVRQELRDMITFRQLNLLDQNWPTKPAIDAIFCRNVMIYFDKPTQTRVLEKFLPLLRPNGLLFAGHSENFHQASHLFRLRSSTVYEPVA